METDVLDSALAAAGHVDCSKLSDFPEVLSFFEKFSPLLDLKSPVLFTDLKNGSESTKQAPSEWKTLHCHLLRRIAKTFKAERWTHELLKIGAQYGIVEISDGGYSSVPCESKLQILKLLCDLQFSQNAKFKEKIDNLDSKALRTDPVGRDRNGNSYFYFQDNDCNLLFYSSPKSTLETFDLLANTRETLIFAIERLKSEIPLADNKIEETEVKEETEKHSSTVDEKPSKTPNADRTDSCDSQKSRLESSSPVVSEQGLMRSSSRNAVNGTSSRSTSAASGKLSRDLDSPEKPRGTTSPVISSSPTRSRGRSSAKPSPSSNPPTSLSPSKTKINPRSKSAKVEKQEPVASVTKKSPRSKSTPKSSVKSTKASVAPKGRGKTTAKGKVASKNRGKATRTKARKEATPVSSSDSSSEKDESSKKTQDESSDSSSSEEEEEEEEEQEVPLSALKPSSGRRTPRAAQLRAVAKISTPKKGAAVGTKSPSSKKVASELVKIPQVSESEEDSDDSDSSVDEYMPASAKRGRGKSRKVPVKPQVKPVRGKAKAPSPELVDSSDIEDDTECHKCHKFNHPGKLLLCDKCDAGYHTFCLVPPIVLIPEGEWFCPVCEHRQLLLRLDEVVVKLDHDLKELAKRQAREKAGKKELMKLMADKWARDEGGSDKLNDSFDDLEGDAFGMRSCRRRNKVDYSMSEYDKKLNDAISGKLVAEEQNEQNPRLKKVSGRGTRGEPSKNVADADDNDNNKLAVKEEDEDDDEYKASEEESEVERNSDDYALPEWCKEEGDSTPRKSRSRQSRHSKLSDEEYRPSEDEEVAPVAKKRPQRQAVPRQKGKQEDDESEDDDDDDDDEGSIPTPVLDPVVPKKRPKNWEEEEYHISWDEGSEGSEWDSDDVSDYGGRKRKKKTVEIRRKKRRRFLYASTESDSDNADYDAYKKRSSKRHRGRRQFPSSEEESEASDEEETESSESSDFTGKRRRPKRKPKVKAKLKKAKSIQRAKAQAKARRSLEDDEEEFVRGSARIAARGSRVNYARFMDEDDERQKKKQPISGKIRLPFEAEDEEFDQKEESEQSDEEDLFREDSPVKRVRVLDSTDVESEEEEELEEEEKEKDAEKDNVTVKPIERPNNIATDATKKAAELSSRPSAVHSQPSRSATVNYAEAESEEDEDEESEESGEEKEDGSFKQYMQSVSKPPPPSGPTATAAPIPKPQLPSSLQSAAPKDTTSSVILPVVTSSVSAPTTTSSFIKSPPPPPLPEPIVSSTVEPSAISSPTSSRPAPVTQRPAVSAYGVAYGASGHKQQPPFPARMPASQQAPFPPYQPAFGTSGIAPRPQQQPIPASSTGAPMRSPVTAPQQPMFPYGAPPPQQQQSNRFMPPAMVSHGSYYQPGQNPSSVPHHMPPHQQSWQPAMPYGGYQDPTAAPPLPPPVMANYPPQSAGQLPPLRQPIDGNMSRPPYMVPPMSSTVNQPPQPVTSAVPSQPAASSAGGVSAPAGTGAFDDFDLEDLGPSAPRAEPVQ